MQTPSNAPLPKPLRTQLENTVKAARDVAEKAGRAALAQLAVAEPKVPDYLDEPQRVLRRKLRAHARAISATSAQNNSVELQPLVLEVAYEHWHRMLFARFLAENNLLMWREPNDANGAAVSLDDCRDMVDNHPDMAMGAKSHWELAGKLAARMLPQVFKPHSPVFEINFAPEHQRELERLLSNLPPEVFQASDSLGWVYQFWQAKRKDEVNASEVKIGADELPAVTQLFTEPYMVDFLLHNSLGAWWHTRHPGQPCPVVMPYLRLISPLANSPHPNPLPGGEGTHSQTADSGCSLPLPPGEGWGEGATTPQAHHHNVPPEHIAFARSLRGSQTDAENLLWSLLRNRRLADSKFRRQHPLGPYVLDFYCHEKKLAIELDGGQHNEETGRAKDARRTAYLAQQGIRVIRFWNNQTLQETQAVLQTIWDALVTETPSPPTPLPQGEGSNSPPVPGYSLPHPLGEGSNSPPAPGYSLPHPLGEGSNSPPVPGYSLPHPPGEGSNSPPAPGYLLPLPLGEGRGEGQPSTPAAGNFEGWPDHLTDFKLLDPSCGSGHFLVAAFLLLVPLRMADEGLSALDAVDAVLAHNLHGLEIDPRCVEIAVFALALAAWRYPDENGNSLGVRPDMPAPRIACCGLRVSALPEDWESLVPDSQPNAALLRQELRLLHSVFAQAPLLGSLLNPSLSIKNDLATSSFETLQTLIEQALSSEQPGTLWGGAQDFNDDAWDLAISARGLLEAARLLDARYHLVVTNVPYLARGKQEQALKDYCEAHYPNAKNDLANVFLERCLDLALPPLPQARPGDLLPLPPGEGRGEGGLPLGAGVVQIVMPQNWLFLTSYKKLRQDLLKRVRWDLLARLGPGAFETISGEVVQAVLLTQTNTRPHPNPLPQGEGATAGQGALALDAAAGGLTAGSCISGVDASAPRTAQGKAQELMVGDLKVVSQLGQLGNPDATISLGEMSHGKLLKEYADSVQGFGTSDNAPFIHFFWELTGIQGGWEPVISAVDHVAEYAGRQGLICWENGQGRYYKHAMALKLEGRLGGWKSGYEAWNKNGISISEMRDMPCTIYTGQKYDNTAHAVIPRNESHLLPIWCFISSGCLVSELRKQHQGLKVSNHALLNVPFDLAHWSEVAAERYPNGLPKPYSDDPTQWLFHGHPVPSTDPLQVAVARLLGYRWPAEEASPPASFPEGEGVNTGVSPHPNPLPEGEGANHPNSFPEGEGADTGKAMELSDEAHAWIARCQRLHSPLPPGEGLGVRVQQLQQRHVDDDGIVCLPAVRGEQPAHERLLALLIDAWETGASTSSARTEGGTARTEDGSARTGGGWTPSVLDKLLAQADNAGKSLAVWLRDSFFEQHAKRFGHRPFIWHVWDGQKDGFGALVNAHKLDAKNLERLIHTYLGDWIRTQEAGVANGADGAPLRLSAAQNLKTRLQAILEGEKPYDIFVRWKPLAQQPIGWNPDRNDGIRLNIRPFMTAEVLRVNKKPKLNITWDKDRGKDVESAPWFHKFNGERINDHHLTLAEKIAAKGKSS